MVTVDGLLPPVQGVSIFNTLDSECLTLASLSYSLIVQSPSFVLGTSANPLWVSAGSPTALVSWCVIPGSPAQDTVRRLGLLRSVWPTAHPRALSGAQFVD